MKNINWSKWIAIALSVFIVTQFIQVSFLAAGQIGGGQANAGADASRGSIAEEVYAGVLDKAAGSDLILSAKAGEAKVTAQVGVGNVLDLSSYAPGALSGIPVSILFSLKENERLSAGDTFSFSLPPNFTLSNEISVEGIGTVAVNDSEATVTLTSDWTSETGTTVEANIGAISYSGSLEAKESADDVSATSVSWAIVEGSTAKILLPKTDYVVPADPDPASDPASDPDFNPASAPDLVLDSVASITVKVVTDGETPTELDAAEFALKRSDSADGDYTDYATITVAAAPGAVQSLENGYYQMEQTSAKEGYTSLSGIVDFYVSDGVVIATSGNGWSYEGGVLTVTNASAVVMASPRRLMSAAPPVKAATVTVEVNRSVLVPEWDGSKIDEGKDCFQPLNGVTYTLYKSDKSTKVGDFSATSSAGVSSQDVTLEIGTYYLKEGNVDSQYTGVKIANIELVNESNNAILIDGEEKANITSEITDGFIPIEVTKDGTEAKTIKVILAGFRHYEVELLNGSSTTKKLTGKTVTIGQDGNTATAIWAAYNGMMTVTPGNLPTGTGNLVWTSDETPLKLDGVLVSGVTYAVKIGENTDKVTFSIDKKGDLQTPNPNDANGSRPYGKLDTTNKAILSIHQQAERDIEIQLKDSAGDIAGTGADYALYSDSEKTQSVILTFSSGKLTAKGLTADGASSKSYYLVENKQPTGYTAKGTALGTITINADGTVSYPTSSGWALAENKVTLTYDRIKPTLTIIRPDATTSATAIPSTLTYGVYTDASGTSSTGVSVPLSKGESGATGTIPESASLNWGTRYYIRETGDYTGKDEAVHGPYTFDTTAVTDAVADTTKWTLTPQDMTIKVTVTPAVKKEVSFKYNDAAGKAVSSATFTIKDQATEAEETLTITSGEGKLTDLLTGHTYTVTQASGKSDGTVDISYTFKMENTGAATIVTQTGGTVTSDGKTPSVITMTERLSELTFTMEICTAEQGYDTYVSEDAETVTKEGFEFTLYDKNKKKVTTSLTASGEINTDGTAETDSNGTVSFYGLADTTYYVKCSTSTSDDVVKEEAPQVSLDTKSYFKVTMENGALKSLTKGSGDWTVENGKTIRAYLKEGKITVTAKTDKTFYLYRLYNGSGSSEDNRETSKLEGDIPSDLKNATKGTDYVLVADAAEFIKKELEKLDSFFVLKAMAAESAKTISHGGYTWELIGSKKPGNGSSSSFEGLIAGQPYLVREGDSETPGDSDNYYLVKQAGTSSKVAGVASTASTANTAKSGASNASTSKTTTGSGTASGGGAAGARGSATGDGNDLWAHLIVMLIAFDALVADLLYISRKKQPVQSR